MAELAGSQFNRVSRRQLDELGLSEKAIAHRVAAGRLVAVEQGVYAVAPLLEHDPWGRWMGATLTAQESHLSRESAAAAYGFWSLPRRFECVTRPGDGGPRRHGGVLVFRSATLEGECGRLQGIPITSVPRTLLDIAGHASTRAVARAVREAVRLRLITVVELSGWLYQRRHRRGARRLTAALARYSGLPLERARSGAEVRALEVLRDAGRRSPELNRQVAGEEADLVWPHVRLIIEVDGGPFHLDKGEDARRQARWEGAGWTVRRIDAGDVYEHPERLLCLAPPANVPEPSP